MPLYVPRTARSKTLRNFISKISQVNDTNAPKPQNTFIHAYNFMTYFNLSNGVSARGIMINSNAAKNQNGNAIDSDNAKNQETLLPGDYITSALKLPNTANGLEFYIKDIKIPNVKAGAGRTTTLDDSTGAEYGINYDKYILSNGGAGPDDRELILTLYDTEESVIDGFFMPWLQAISSPITKVFDANYNGMSADRFVPSARFNYEGTLSIFQLSDITGTIIRCWKFRNIVPQYIATPDFSHDGSSDIITREIQFTFDRMTYTNYISTEQKNYPNPER